MDDQDISSALETTDRPVRPIESITSLGLGEIHKGDRFTQDIIGAAALTTVLADNAVPFTFGVDTELLFMQTRASSVTLSLIAAEDPDPGTGVSQFVTGASETTTGAYAVAKVRLDARTLTNLANSLRSHVRQHYPQLAEQLLP